MMDSVPQKRAAVVFTAVPYVRPNALQRTEKAAADHLKFKQIHFA